MTLIGCRCTRCEPFSRAVLITRTLLFKSLLYLLFQYVQYNSAKVLDKIKAVIAQGLHLLPFRTEKLNLATPMVLPTRESRKRPPYRRGYNKRCVLSFFNTASNVAQTLGGHLTKGVEYADLTLFFCSPMRRAHLDSR